LFAGVVVLDTRDWTIVEQQGAVMETSFPYVSGLLSFREAPALLAAFAKVQAEPDVVVIDGQGIAHPRRLGLAAHGGLWLGRSSVPRTACSRCSSPSATALTWPAPLTWSSPPARVTASPSRRAGPTCTSTNCGRKPITSYSTPACRGRRLPAASGGHYGRRL